VLQRAACSALLAAIAIVTLSAAQEPEQRATFRSAADLVSVAVIVRDADGRLVSDLEASDFEVLDKGTAQPIMQFQQGDDADARVAILVDSSGSMVLGGRERSRLAAEFLTDAFRSTDAASVFSFDSRIHRLTPFTNDAAAVRAAVSSVEPYGLTGLYDAVISTVRVVSDEAPRARAVLLLTDGVDTGSKRTPAEAAAAAAAVDLPLYVLAVGGEDPRSRSGANRAAAEDAFTLHDLAVRTGGLAAEPRTPEQLRKVTQNIVTELRHQYVLAFPAGTGKGWHDLTVRVRRGRVQARSREGYYVM
jgi:Ca-activated chloride channel homolog